MATWVIFGCGYVGTRLARQLLADGHEVRACSRNAHKLVPLAALGAHVFEIDGSKRRAFGPALFGTSEARVVFSIPPIPGSPPGLTVGRAGEASQLAGARSFVYLGSTAVYGETPSGEVVDEASPIAISDPEAGPRISEESAVETAQISGVRTVILRLAAIYGPGRGVRERLKKGDYRLIDDGVHWYSRIHVDDLCSIIRAVAEKAPVGSRYCVADDRPSTQHEYVEWLCGRMGLEMPLSVESLAPGKRRRLVRNRKVSNEKLKRELGLTLRYPSFVEGELAIEAETSASVTVPVATAPVATPIAVAAPIAVATPEKSTPPELIELAAGLHRWLHGTADERLQLREALREVLEALKAL